jgi:membrane dipeptidase
MERAGLPFADMHSHFLLNAWMLDRPFSRPEPDRLPWGPFGNRIGMDGAISGGVGCITFTVYAPSPHLRGFPTWRWTLGQVRAFRRLAGEDARKFNAVRTGAEARAVAAGGGVAGILAVEGGHSLQGDLRRLDDLAAEGVRMLSLAHFVSNDLADVGSCPWKPNGGLSSLGREALVRMERLGMIPDVAHLSDEAVRDFLAVAEGPVVDSHTGMRHLCDISRNLPDDLARGIAGSGGIVGIVLFPPYLARGLGLAQSLDRFLDHCCHAASIAGVDHVGIGTDLDGFTWPPRGIRGYQDFPAIADGLGRRGFSEQEILAMMGGNYLRLLG